MQRTGLYAAFKEAVFCTRFGTCCFGFLVRFFGSFFSFFFRKVFQNFSFFFRLFCVFFWPFLAFFWPFFGLFWSFWNTFFAFQSWQGAARSQPGISQQLARRRPVDPTQAQFGLVVSVARVGAGGRNRPWIESGAECFFSPAEGGRPRRRAAGRGGTKLK